MMKKLKNRPMIVRARKELFCEAQGIFGETFTLATCKAAIHVGEPYVQVPQALCGNVTMTLEPARYCMACAKRKGTISKNAVHPPVA